MKSPHHSPSKAEKIYDWVWKGPDGVYFLVQDQGDGLIFSTYIFGAFFLLSLTIIYVVLPELESLNSILIAVGAYLGLVFVCCYILYNWKTKLTYWLIDTQTKTLKLYDLKYTGRITNSKAQHNFSEVKTFILHFGPSSSITAIGYPAIARLDNGPHVNLFFVTSSMAHYVQTRCKFNPFRMLRAETNTHEAEVTFLRRILGLEDTDLLEDTIQHSLDYDTIKYSLRLSRGLSFDEAERQAKRHMMLRGLSR